MTAHQTLEKIPMAEFLEKQLRLADPVATTGDQLYIICSQNGLFPDSWSRGHVPHEHWGVWAHPIKLLDGCWFAIHNRTTGITGWLMEADGCRVYPTHTEFDYRIDALQITRRDFVPDEVLGLAMTIMVTVPPDFSEELELVALVRSDLRPAWLGETVGMVDGLDVATTVAGAAYVTIQDSANPWQLIVGGSVRPRTVATGADAGLFHATHGQGTTVRLTFPFHLASANTLGAKLLVAASTTGAAEALEQYAALRTDYGALWETKQARYARITATSNLTTPNEVLDAAFHWSKIGCQWLARATATHGLVAGAGLPNYPWWFGIDTAYAVPAMLQAGFFDLTKATLRLLKDVSTTHNANEPGRVIHELSTTGVVYNPGNLVETPTFTRAVHQTWLWTGDQAFLAEMYPFCKQGLLDYTLGQCDPDGDLCPSGRSVIETLEMHADFECIDVATYTWEALGCLAELAQASGDDDVIPGLTAMRAALAERIRSEWWLPAEGLFADVRATVQKVTAALHRLDTLKSDPNWPAIQPQVTAAHRYFDAQVAARQAGAQDVDLPWLLRHWVVMCPLEVGLATPAQAAQSFERLRSPEFCNAWGMYLHPERQDVMSINTGLLALALLRYGRIDDALRLVTQMAGALTLRMPGAISEALPGEWCFLQLWSALGIITPLVEGVLGIAPRAAERQLRVIPHLPSGWREARLQQLRVGDERFDIAVTQWDKNYQLTVQGTAVDYALTVGFYLPATAAVKTVLLNGKPADWRWAETLAGRALLCDAVGSALLQIQLACDPY